MNKTFKKIVIVSFIFSMFTINIDANVNKSSNDYINNNQVLLASDFDVSKLQLLIEIVEKEDLSQYTDESYKTLSDSLIKAKAVVSSPTDQNSIDQAEDYLSIAFKYAEKSHIKQLQNLVSEVEIITNTINNYNLNIVTVSSMNILNGEIIGAKVFLKEQPTNEEGALKVFNSLMKATRDLVYVEDQNKTLKNINTELVNLVKKTEEINSYNYVRDGVKLLNTAKKAAIKSLNFTSDSDNTITKHKLFVAKHALNKTINELEELEGNKLKLETLIKEVEELDLKLYEQKGQKELLEALASAKKLLKDNEEDKEVIVDKEVVIDKEDAKKENEKIEAKLDKLYEEALINLSEKKDNLKLIVPEIVPGENPEADPDIPPVFDDNNQNPSNPDKWTINSEIYLFIAIIIGTLIMISIIGYNRYKDKEESNN